MNNIITKSIKVCKYRLRDKLINKRTLVVVIFLFIYVFLQEQGISDFCVATASKCSPWCFSLLTNDWIAQMLISGIFIWFVSVVSEKNYSDVYIYYRSGKISWEIGSLFAIIIMALVYLFFLIVFSVLVLIPNIDFSLEWGRVWKLLSHADVDVQNQFNINLNIDGMIIHKFTPVSAFLHSVVLQLLLLIMLAIIQYCLNGIGRGYLGSYLALSLILLDVLISNTSLEMLYKFSPVTLVQLGKYSIDCKRFGYSYGYSIVFYLVISSGVWILYILSRGVKEKYGQAKD